MAAFKTPVKNCNISKLLQDDKKSGTPPFVIPPSPSMKRLGYGTGVNVYLLERYSPMRGCYKSPWAVKKINLKIGDNPEYKDRLDEEAKILKTLKHPNIIGYRSYTKNKDGTPCLVMESGEKSLADIIEARQELDLGPFEAADILKVALDLVSALHYLHKEKLILHGDLKSANILIKGDFDTVKLCDFGVTVPLDDKGNAKINNFYVGTECWSAPEAIHGGNISDKTDMFPYGLILWEMLSLFAPHMDKLNYETLENELDEDKKMQEEYEMEERYNKALGTRPEVPESVICDSYLPIIEIFYACTEEDPAKRPSAEQVLHHIKCLDSKENKSLEANGKGVKENE
ncbi:lymphokine-activated killer T-cell-originated protein kinase-like isoform X2 [Oratosquilla oratoria]